MSDGTRKPQEPTEEEILARMEAEEEVRRRRNAAVEWEIAAATRPSDHPLPPESHPHTRYLLAKKHLEEERGITREAEGEMTPEEQDAFEEAVLHETDHVGDLVIEGPLLERILARSQSGSDDTG